MMPHHSPPYTNSQILPDDMVHCYLGKSSCYHTQLVSRWNHRIVKDLNITPLIQVFVDNTKIISASIRPGTQTVTPLPSNLTAIQNTGFREFFPGRCLTDVLPSFWYNVNWYSFRKITCPVNQCQIFMALAELQSYLTLFNGQSSLLALNPSI